MQNKQAEELREIRITRSETPFHAALLIYGDKVGFISFRENFLGVTIESIEISAMMRIGFEMMLESLQTPRA